LFNFAKNKLNKNNSTMNRSIGLFVLMILISCASEKRIVQEPEIISTNIPGATISLEIDFIKGKAYNHPSFAFWIEDLGGNYIETLFVTRFVATGIYEHGEHSPGRWSNTAGEARRPASLPYWSHKRGLQAPDGLYIPSSSTPVPDALTSATPQSGFLLRTGTTFQKGSKFRLLMEINQPWDSNPFWVNSKYEGDPDYFTSLQPALVYAVTIDPASGVKEYFLNPIGHGHPSGKDGKLYTDISTLTTAREIVQKIIVRIK
jgi:hypothetical protein